MRLDSPNYNEGIEDKLLFRANKNENGKNATQDAQPMEVSSNHETNQ